MKPTTIFLVQLPNASNDLVRKAAEKAFPHPRFVSVNSVAEAAKKSLDETRRLLVLTDRDESAVALATHVTDEHDYPRWAVIVLGRNPSELAESVLPEECNPALLARVFRSAMQQHELLRENLRLHGDLKTVARRFNHDLLTPLNCMHITCEVMNELLDQATSLVKEQVGNIQNSLAETCKLIDRVSYLIKASTEPLPTSSVPMEGVIDSVLGQLESEIRLNGATVENPGNWPEVTAVEPWLEIIWWNLIINAVKHGRPSSPVQLGWGPQDTNMRFWVANQGEPVPAELQPRLFQRFDHLHKAPSAGFGLPLVERLVSLQGGKCGYEPQGADGSKFFFTLPLARAG